VLLIERTCDSTPERCGHPNSTPVGALESSQRDAFVEPEATEGAKTSFLFLLHLLFIWAATRQPSRNSLADILLKYNLIDAETCLLWFSQDCCLHQSWSSAAWLYQCQHPTSERRHVAAPPMQTTGPSSHSTACASCAGFAAHRIFQEMKNRRERCSVAVGVRSSGPPCLRRLKRVIIFAFTPHCGKSAHQNGL
jgi:hypothetical protein